jgi:hypothetical protein
MTLDRLRRAAESVGLLRLASLLPQMAEHEALDFAAVPVDPRLETPAPEEPFDSLPLLVRRGLDPRLIEPLIDKLAGRPLEQGLFAWDALNRALLAPSLVDKLRALIAPVRAFLPDAGKGGLDLNRHPGALILPRFAMPGTDVELMAHAFQQSLGAFAELEKRNDALLRRPATRESIRAFGRLLSMAHLPTAASLYLDWLSRGLGERGAALDLLETMFDAGAAERCPADGLREGDFPPAELHDVAEYLVYRTWLALGDAHKAYTLVEANLKARPRELPSPSARLVVTRAHLASLFHARPVSLERVDRLYEDDKTWRYGARARLVAASAQSAHGSAEPFRLLYDFISGFGNDLSATTEALAIARPAAGWKREAARLLARECVALPHEPAAWKPLAMFLGDQTAVNAATAEIDDRLHAQARQ